MSFHRLAVEMNKQVRLGFRTNMELNADINASSLHTKSSYWASRPYRGSMVTPFADLNTDIAAINLHPRIKPNVYNDYIGGVL